MVEDFSKMSTEEMKRELDNLCGRYHGLNVDTLHDYETKHEYLNTHGPYTYGRFKDQFRAWFDLANQIVIGLNYIDKKEWPKHRALQYLFIIHNIRVIYSAVDRLLKGHWEDSLILCRVALEAFVRIIWISCHPTISEAGVLKTKQGKQFNFTGFVEDELKLEWHSYEFLSKVTHGIQIGVIKDWVALQKGTKKYPLTLERSYDKIMLELGINYIEFLEVVYLLFSTEVLVNSTNDKYLPLKIIQDAQKLARLKQESMRRHRRSYWPQVAKDVDDLIELIKICEKNGQGYKKHWTMIRRS